MISCRLLVQAVVDPPHERIYAHVGLGVYVELSLSAALEVCQQRRRLLNDKLSSCDHLDELEDVMKT
jgi:prefoldin subunit 5